jgi:hypothetical protein
MSCGVAYRLPLEKLKNAFRLRTRNRPRRRAWVGQMASRSSRLRRTSRCDIRTRACTSNSTPSNSTPRAAVVFWRNYDTFARRDKRCAVPSWARKPTGAAHRQRRRVRCRPFDGKRRRLTAKSLASGQGTRKNGGHAKESGSCFSAAGRCGVHSLNFLSWRESMSVNERGASARRLGSRSLIGATVLPHASRFSAALGQARGGLVRPQ